MHRPSWFKKDKVLISFADTVGINKDGEELYVVDPATGKRTDQINDRLSQDVSAVLKDGKTSTSRWVSSTAIRKSGIAVPVYYDRRAQNAYKRMLKKTWPGFSSISLGELMKKGELIVRGGHGSPSADLRSGEIPYIKVSDLRAGHVNINPTNRVSKVVAEKYWGGETSGLKPFDLITPARTSRNIGEVAVLMPGQQRVVLTKEMLVIRPGPEAKFDAFYLLWAMSLTAVRQQWKRIIFMQTNREDTGRRFKEIEIPMAPTTQARTRVSQPFRRYYQGMAELREDFLAHLSKDSHHDVFLTS